MAVPVGEKLGHYEVLSPLGQGGMGEVYCARDTKLGRMVAIKVLPDVFANNPERLARFEREAKVLAALNHPNIAAIYGLEERALVMELVEGPTLADRARQGAIPMEEALGIAKQIADALEAAHEMGIVHRDLKPDNVKVTPAGVVKVLDFGLAKAAEEPTPSGNPMNSPTLTISPTRVGTILGTAAYMSPEQASGKPVDKRADIWSFGVVLWEMLTGKRLFDGETVTHTLADVLRGPIDFDALPKATPATIRDLLRRSLDRDVKTRLRDIGEARVTIAKYLADPQGATEAPRRAEARPTKLLWVWAALATLAALALGLVHFRDSLPSGRTARFEVAMPAKTSIDTFEISPDGRFLAITADDGRSERLYVRPLDSLEPHAIPGTEGARYPIWSPDSSNIAFFAQGKLKRIALTGGSPQVLCDVPDGHGGAWSQDNVILFSPGARSALQKVSAFGGVPSAVTRLANAGDSHRYPRFLPGGLRFLYLMNTDKAETTGIYGGFLDGTPSVRLLPDPSNAAFAPAASGHTGYLLFQRVNTLMAQPIDPDHLQLVGELFPVVQDVAPSGNTFHGGFSASTNGLLAYWTSSARTELGSLQWVDLSGKRLGTIAVPGVVREFSLSPDGKRIAAVVLGGAMVNSGSGSVRNGDVWLGDVDRGTLSRFTFGSNAYMPVWSPDGSRIILTTRDPHVSRYQILQKSVGSGQQQLLYETAAANVYPYDWSSDGKFVVYGQDAEQTKRDLWLLPMDGEHKPFVYLQTPFDETSAQFSPDGKWMAYGSDESGQSQVYVQTIPAGRAKYQVSTAGGRTPRWRRDGRELFYISADQKLTAVPVKTGATFEAGTPRSLFDAPVGLNPRSAFAHLYQPSADGQRFLLNLPPEGATSPPIDLVLNWQAELKK